MTNETMSPLRRRMIEDMTIRNFGPKTHHDYIRSVRSLAVFLGRSPDTASNEDVVASRPTMSEQTGRRTFERTGP